MRLILFIATALIGLTHASLADPPFVLNPASMSGPGWSKEITASVETWSAENPLPPVPQPAPAEVIETRVVMSAPRYLSDATSASRYFGPGRLDRLHLAYQRLPFFLG